MHHHLFSPLLHYDVKQMKHLFMSTALRLFGAGMLGVFVPLLIFQIGVSYQSAFYYVLVFFLIQSLASIVFSVFGSANVIHRRGTKASMCMGIVSLLLYQNLFYWFEGSLVLVYVAPLFIAFFGSFFWTAFHFNIAVAKKQKTFGEQVAMLNIIITITLALAPLFGGFILDRYGILPVVMIANGFVLLSFIPLLLSGQHHKDCFPQKKSMISKSLIKQMVHEHDTQALKTFASKGYAEFVGVVLWPIMIFVVYQAFSSVGLVVTATTIVSVLLLFATGKLLDKHQDNLVMRWTIGAQVVTWLIATGMILLNIFNGIMLSFIDMMSRFTKSVGKTCIEKRMYVFSDDKKTNLVHIMLHEVSLYGLRALSCIVALMIHSFFGMTVTITVLLVGLLLIVPWQYDMFRKKIAK